MDKQRILVVDDEEGILEVCSDTLARLSNVEVVVEQSSPKALELLSSDDFALLITDIRMPEIDGLELLRLARKRDANLTILMMTAFPTAGTAVESMKLGAADYISKPFMPEELLAAVAQLLEGRSVKQERSVLQRQVDRPYAFDEIIGSSVSMQSVFETIRRTSEIDADVLITGETGVGKELVARSIHKRSKRAERRFVALDCGAIPDNLMESELFGHERGAFTGADRQNLGLLEFADGGTFFLDEIGELQPAFQAKLLRALQEREIRRVGGRRQIPINVRILAATQRDLPAEIRAGNFRADLYYRINVASVVVPPLRERGDDITTIATHYISRFAREMDKDEPEVSADLLEVLQRYPWPGNVRELGNVIKRTLAMSSGSTLTADDLPDEVVARAGDPADGDDGGFLAARSHRMASFEREYLVSLLQLCKGDVSEAARRARLPRGTLYRFLKKHGVQPGDFRS